MTIEILKCLYVSVHYRGMHSNPPGTRGIQLAHERNHRISALQIMYQYPLKPSDQNDLQYEQCPGPSLRKQASTDSQ